MIKRLAGSIREFKKPTLLTPLLMILEVAMECLIPMIMSKLVDYGINEQNMQQIFFWGILLVCAAALSLFFGAMAGRTAAVASCGFARNLRKAHCRAPSPRGAGTLCRSCSSNG